MSPHLISVEEASSRLGVVPQRVRVLVAEGRLPAERVGKGYVLDAAVVDRFARAPRVRGRPLSAANAWALLASVAGIPVEQRLAARPIRSRGRIESLIARGSDAVAVALRRSQPRAALHAWRVLPGDVEALLGDRRLVRSGLSADDAGINVRYQADRDGVDAYVSPSAVRDLKRKLRPIENSAGANVRLHVPEGDQWVLDEPVAPLAVVAADLLNHDDPRVARAALQALEQLLP